MTTENTSTKPLYRISFSRITGKDDQGSDTLGKPREIGVAWERKGDKQSAIIQLDMISTDLINYYGVMFLAPVSALYCNKAGRMRSVKAMHSMRSI